MAMAQQASLSVFLSLLVALLLVVVTLGPAAVHGDEDRLTPEEVELVGKFREIVKDLTYKDYMTTDEYLVRWLRVRNNNLKGAREVLADAIEWRKKNGIDNILAEDLSDIDNELQVMFEGEDKQGRPLLMMNIGTLDVRKLAISGRSKRLLRYFVQCLELAMNVLRDMNAEEGSTGNRTKVYIVLDLHGFNLRQHACPQCIPFLISALRIYESYYPDMAHRMRGINVPRVFMPVFELVRPLLSDTTRGVIELFDSNADRWKKAMRDDIAEDQLAKQYGGTRTVQSKTIGGLKKRNHYVKAVFDRAAAEAEKQHSKPV